LTSEHNRLDYSGGYVYHHVLSLLDLTYQLHARMPMKPHFAIYASLATEVFSSLGCALAIMGLKAVNSSLGYTVQASTVVPADSTHNLQCDVHPLDPRTELGILAERCQSRYICQVQRRDVSFRGKKIADD
jgi:hypothetical protein